MRTYKTLNTLDYRLTEAINILDCIIEDGVKKEEIINYLKGVLVEQ